MSGTGSLRSMLILVRHAAAHSGEHQRAVTCLASHCFPQLSQVRSYLARVLVQEVEQYRAFLFPERHVLPQTSHVCS